MELRPTLACGGELKNTFCLANGRYAFLSPHIGDLENYETLASYEAMIDASQKTLSRRARNHRLRFAPELSEYAVRNAGRKSQVARRHVRPATCVLRLSSIITPTSPRAWPKTASSGPVIGVALDGTGYGTDGRIWGGEFLVADFAGFTRAAHLEYLPLPGGEAAIHKPWRIAVGYAEALGLDIAGLPFLRIGER